MPDQELFKVGDLVVWAVPHEADHEFVEARRRLHGNGPFRVSQVEDCPVPEREHPQVIAIEEGGVRVGGDHDIGPNWSGVWFRKAR